MGQEIEGGVSPNNEQIDSRYLNERNCSVCCISPLELVLALKSQLYLVHFATGKIISKSFDLRYNYVWRKREKMITCCLSTCEKVL